MTTFGTKLRKLREAKGLTQAEAAELVGIPMQSRCNSLKNTFVGQGKLQRSLLPRRKQSV